MNVQDSLTIPCLPNELWYFMAQHLEAKDLVALSRVNKNLRDICLPVFKELYQKTFGELDEKRQAYPSTYLDMIFPFQFCGKPPSSVDHNIYKIPQNLLNRWKWLIGIDNSLDREVQGNYDRCVKLLENTQATSITQLRNKLWAFWHLNCQMDDYKKFSAKERNKGSVIQKIFRALAGYFLTFLYDLSEIKDGKSIAYRTNKTYAKIGEFETGVRNYDILAQFVQKQHEPNPTHPLQGFGPGSFASIGHNRTRVKIIDKKMSLESESRSFTIYSKKREDEGDDRKSYLKISKCNLGGATSEESNQTLERKLIQIMFEMTQQNRECEGLNLKFYSSSSDLPVLIAGGFKTESSDICEQIMKDIESYREENEGNKLFPPHKRYYYISKNFKEFKRSDLEKANVHYSRDGLPESWSDIIAREGPILKQNSGILQNWATL